MVLFSAALMTIFPVWVIFSLPLDNKYNKTPFVRFVCNLTSHIYFMIIQICVACWPIYPIYRQTMMPYWIEWLLVVWLSGLLLEQLSEQQDRSGLAAIKVINAFIQREVINGKILWMKYIKQLDINHRQKELSKQFSKQLLQFAIFKNLRIKFK